MKNLNAAASGLHPVYKQTSRRDALIGLGLGALGISSLDFLPSRAKAGEKGRDNDDVPPGASSPIAATDIDLLNFALNLEYLEAEFYCHAATGTGLEAQGIVPYGVGHHGFVILPENPQVPFATPAIQQCAREIAEDELNHVRLLRSVLGKNAVARPFIDLIDSFTAAAQAAGIIGAGDTLDPFADETSFLLAAFILEDVAVTAYCGAAPLLSSKMVLSAVAGLLGTEAYHAGTIRTKINEAGAAEQHAAEKISELRYSLDGTMDDDQGVVLNGMANIIPTDDNGLVFARTMAQVLAIVYLSPTAKKGGFFPSGINTGRRS